MGHLQRALPAHTIPSEHYAFVADWAMMFDDTSANETPRDGVTPIHRPQPSEDLLDDTLADSFPASDPPAWY